MRLEYIWLDGNDFPQIRSKTRFHNSVEDWNFDGGSTKQGDLNDSDKMLRPIKEYPDPFHQDGVSKLVLCEVMNYDGTPHKTNHRAKLIESGFSSDDWFGVEQEFTIFNPSTKQPIGLLLEPEKQEDFYCGNGRKNIIGRFLMDEFINFCEKASINLAGINAEVMPGQWEYQIKPSNALSVADDLWVSRYILERISEKYNIDISYSPKPHPDFNGAGCHINFSTPQMREDLSEELLQELMKSLESSHLSFLHFCGKGFKDRLSGKCETSSWDSFSWGVGDRGASIRVPQKVKEEGKGYIEDRRPCANIDPYKTFRYFLLSVYNKV